MPTGLPATCPQRSRLRGGRVALAQRRQSAPLKDFAQASFRIPGSVIRNSEAGGRDFQNTPAKNETLVNSILINDYLRILNQSGWQETHIF